jgi:2-iminobutanoate/2-iminopropanoate deaminase
MKKVISTTNSPKAVGPYSQGISIENFIYTSGQIPLDPKTGEIVSQDIEDQTHQSLKNLQAVVAAGGAVLEDVVKVNIFLTDMGDFSKVNEIYKQYFSKKEPARSCVEVSSLPLGVKIEIEAVAVKGDVD